MLVIKNSDGALQAQLAAAHTTAAGKLQASWRQITPATPNYTPDSFYGDTNGATAVTMAAQPATGTYLVADYIGYYNADTANQTLTVLVGTNVLFKAVLAPGERVEYVDGKGWAVYMNNGAQKVSATNGASPVSSELNVAVLASDVTNNNGTANTIQDVTGLSFAVTAGQRYRFRFCIPYTAAATTTGSRWSITGPGSPTELRYRSQYSLTTTSRTSNDGLSTYDAPAASNASSAATGSNLAEIEGFITPSANGTVIARFASEIASSAIVAKAGAFVEWLAL